MYRYLPQAHLRDLGGWGTSKVWRHLGLLAFACVWAPRRSAHRTRSDIATQLANRMPNIRGRVQERQTLKITSRQAPYLGSLASLLPPLSLGKTPKREGKVIGAEVEVQRWLRQCHAPPQMACSPIKKHKSSRMQNPYKKYENPARNLASAFCVYILFKRAGTLTQTPREA